MKTPPDGKSGGVDFSWVKQLWNQAGAHRHLATLPSQNQPKSVSATIDIGEKPDRSTDFGYLDLLQVAHSCQPLMGINEYPAGRILRGKWVLHV